MNKLFLLIFAGVLCGVNVAHAVETRPLCPFMVDDRLEPDYTITDTCYADNAISACYDSTTGSYHGCSSSTTEITDNGVAVTYTAGIQRMYNDSAQTISCRCNLRASVTYKCAAGYYGNPTSETSSCTPCPNHSLTGPATSPVGATKITDCYITTGATWTDDKGTLRFEEDCHYTE